MFSEKIKPGKETGMGNKSRQVNYEALRILSMFMIIAMHYLQKGGVLLPLSEDRGIVNLLAWLVETFCIGAANLYVLLCGYFLMEASWRWKKLVSLVAQVLFYSLGVSLVCLALGIGGVRNWSLYDWATVILPLQSEHYWFATAYFGLYLFVPVLQAGVKQLTKRQLEIVLACMLIFFSLEKTFSPVALAYDRYGYDLGWFICLFLIATYLRLYGEELPKGRTAGMVYAWLGVLIWLLGLVLGNLTQKGLPLSYMGDMLYSYNHLLVLLLSLALFRAFKGLTVLFKWMEKWILALSPCCFGVYLLHEHIAIRYLWPRWLGVDKVGRSLLFLPHMLVCIIIIFGVGAAVEHLRSRIFALVIKKLERTKR